MYIRALERTRCFLTTSVIVRPLKHSIAVINQTVRITALNFAWRQRTQLSSLFLFAVCRGAPFRLSASRLDSYWRSVKKVLEMLPNRQDVKSDSCHIKQCSCKSYVYWTVHHLDSWIKRGQLDVTCFIISLFNAQHVSDVNISILRSLRLICWVIAWVELLCKDRRYCISVLI